MRRSVFLMVLVVVVLAASLACAAPKGLTPGEGFVDVPGGKIWYRIVGSGMQTPLLVVNGGPGIPYFYLKPLTGLSGDRPVIFFDQLGSGRSKCPDDTTQWTVEKFVEEIPAIRKALGLEKIHLYGHSWGTIMAADYLLTKPSGVESCIMAGPALSIPIWIKGVDSLLKTLPDSVQQVIATEERFTSDAYQSALMVFYNKYVARKLPWSVDTDSSFSQINYNMYLYMQGPSEFTITGTLKDHDRTKQLGQIKVPTLFLVGEYDEATPASAKYFQSLIPGSKLSIIPDAAHLAMQDDSAKYVETLRQFLKGVESK